jgi:low affinity Fe/Cu permease
MVFIIQNTQNRDGPAIQTKLDSHSDALAKLMERLELGDDQELLNRLVGVEGAPERDIKSEQERVRHAGNVPAVAAWRIAAFGIRSVGRGRDLFRPCRTRARSSRRVRRR